MHAFSQNFEKRNPVDNFFYKLLLIKQFLNLILALHLVLCVLFYGYFSSSSLSESKTIPFSKAKIKKVNEYIFFFFFQHKN